MFFSSALVAGLAISVVEASSVEWHREWIVERLAGTCPSSHIIVARASGEPQGEGIIGQVANATLKDNPGMTAEAIVYPATLNNYPYSSGNGTQAMTEALDEFTSECPDTKVVLMGYSQGAQVVGDAVCGGGGLNLGTQASEFTPPASKSVSDKIVAMIQMGDPRFIANLTFDRGTSKRDGIFPRPENISCVPYAEKIRSYCDEGDVYCAGGTSVVPHLIYVGLFGDQARAFVNARLKGENPTTDTSIPSGAYFTQASTTSGSSTSSGSASATTTGSTAASTGFHGVGANGTNTVRPSGTGATTGASSGSTPSSTLPGGSSNMASSLTTPLGSGAMMIPVALLFMLL